MADRHAEFMTAFSPVVLPAKKTPASFGPAPQPSPGRQGALFGVRDPGENGKNANGAGPLNPGFGGLWEHPGPEHVGINPIEEKANGLPQPHVAETIQDANGEPVHLATYLHHTDNYVHYSTGSGKPLPQGITYAFKRDEDSGEYRTVGYLSTYHPQHVLSPTMSDPDKTLPYREIAGLGVDPDERGTGIAVSMVKHAYKAIAEHEGEHLAGSTELTPQGRQFSKKVAGHVGDVRNERGESVRGSTYSVGGPRQAVLPGMEDHRDFDEIAEAKAVHRREHEPRLRALGATDMEIHTHQSMMRRGDAVGVSRARALEQNLVDNKQYEQDHGSRLRAMGANQRAMRMHRAAWDVRQPDTAAAIEDLVRAKDPGWHDPHEAAPEPASASPELGSLPAWVEESNQLNASISRYMSRHT